MFLTRLAEEQMGALLLPGWGGVQPSRRMGRTRHLFICRLAGDGVVDRLGLVHDGMVLSRVAERMVRADDSE